MQKQRRELNGLMERTNVSQNGAKLIGFIGDIHQNLLKNIRNWFICMKKVMWIGYLSHHCNLKPQIRLMYIKLKKLGKATKLSR